MEVLVEKLNAAPTAPDQAVAYLEKLVGEFKQVDDPASLFPHLFAFFEARPEAELDVSRPLVHFMESHYPAYLDELANSLERRPTYHAVWMVNRVLNSDLSADDREILLQWLASVEEHPDADDLCKETARQFLSVQLESHES